jgi:hypothetical protein
MKKVLGMGKEIHFKRGSALLREYTKKWDINYNACKKYFDRTQKPMLGIVVLKRKKFGFVFGIDFKEYFFKTSAVINKKSLKPYSLVYFIPDQNDKRVCKRIYVFEGRDVKVKAEYTNYRSFGRKKPAKVTLRS